MTPPSSNAVAVFGGQGPPVLLPGGEGRSWRAGNIVLKPADGPVEHLEWEERVLSSVEEAGTFRVVPPLRSNAGALVVDGWHARPYLGGRHEPGRWIDILRAADAFHAAIAAQPRPGLLAARTDRWAEADRVAWGEALVGGFAGVPFVATLAQAREPVDDPSQVIHGDLTGNTVFADPDPPAILDFSAYWRPTAFASAVVVADALVWEGADQTILAAVAHIDRFGQYLIRALIFRLLSERAPMAAASRYAPAVELALSLGR